MIYQLNYTNTGNQTATGVVITEIVPDNSTFDFSNSTAGWSCSDGSMAGTTCTLVVGTLDSGDSGNVNFAVRINDTLPAGVEVINNTVNINDDGNNGPDPTPENNQDTETTSTIAEPDLKITKTDFGATLTPGNILIYQLNYTNTGNQTATGVVITEIVPDNSTFDFSNSTAGWSCSDGSMAGTTCTLVVGTLDSGDSGNVNFAVRINDTLPAGVEVINNTVNINDDGNNGPDPTPENNQDTEITPIDAAPDLTITKDNGVNSLNPGDILTYTLVIQNIGNQEATGITITDTLPDYVSYISSSDGGLYTGNTVTWSVSNLLPGESVTRTINVAVDPTIPIPAGLERIINLANVTDDGNNGHDPTPENNQDTDTDTLIGSPDLVITKDNSLTQVTVGQTVIYTIDVSNIGNQTASGVIVKETVPDNSTFDFSNSTAGWVCTNSGEAGDTCIFSLGLLEGLSSTSLEFAIRVNSIVDSNTLINNVNVTDDGSSGPDPTPENNQDTDTDTLIGSPDLVITKDNSRSIVNPSDELIYSINVKNIGNIIATGVTVVDTLPEFTSFVSADSGGIYNSDSDQIIWTDITLLPGSEINLNLILKINDTVSAEAKEIINYITVTDDGSNGPDPDTSNNSDTHINILEADTDLTITKSDQTGLLLPNAELVYLLNYANIGNREAQNIIITETVPQLTKISQKSLDAGWQCQAEGNFGDTCVYLISTLQPQESGSIEFIVIGLNQESFNKDTRVINNRVSIEDDSENDPTPNNNISNVNTSVPLANLQIEKEVEQNQSKIDQILTYKIKYANLGVSDATGVIITDKMPIGLEFVSASQNNQNLNLFSIEGDFNSGTTIQFEVGDVPAGVSGIIFVTTKVKSNATKNLINEVNIIANEADPVFSNNFSSAGIEIEDSKKNSNKSNNNINLSKTGIQVFSTLLIIIATTSFVTLIISTYELKKSPKESSFRSKND